MVALQTDFMRASDLDAEQLHERVNWGGGVGTGGIWGKRPELTICPPLHTPVQLSIYCSIGVTEYLESKYIYIARK